MIAAPMLTSSSTSLPFTMKTVGKFPLAVDRDGAGIQIPGGRERARAHVLHGVGGDGSDRRNAGLEGEQIRKAPAVQGHGRHLRAGDDLAHLRAGCFNVELVFDDGNDIGPRAHFENRIDRQCAVRVDDDPGTPIGPESRACDFKIVVADRKAGERIETLVVGSDGLPDSRVGVRCRNGRLGNHARRWDPSPCRRCFPPRQPTRKGQAMEAGPTHPRTK